MFCIVAQPSFVLIVGKMLISVVQTNTSIEVANIEISALGRVCVRFVPSDILTTDFATHTELQTAAFA